MTSRILLLLTLSICLGCQPAKNQSSMIGGGRTARSNTFGPGARPITAGKTWAEVTNSAGDMAFQQELYLLTYPTMSTLPSDDQLGYVSSQGGQSTGVRFWGNARITNGYAVESGSMGLRLEIYDDRTGQTRGDGSVRPNVPIQISQDQPTYVSSGGTVTGGQVYLYFQDKYGMIIMTGTTDGNTFSGTMAYQDDATGNQQRTLGGFVVSHCGFFQCY